jgi:hypothetical protein
MVTSRVIRGHKQFQNNSEASRSIACRLLHNNVLEQDFIPKEGNPAKATIRGKTATLGAYIPYIGGRYFNVQPRILCYAINQNLSQHAPWAYEWKQSWAQDPRAAADRLNRAADEGKAIPIKPYAEGFIPLVAAMVYAGSNSSPWNDQEIKIDDLIALTNFVKFSTARDASSSSIPSSWWAQCGDRYVRKELSILRPDIILAFGHRTHRELMRVVKTISKSNTEMELRLCPFPSRICSVRARPLSRQESRKWSKCILPLVDKLRKPPSSSCHPWRMLDYPRYFLDICDSWNIELGIRPSPRRSDGTMEVKRVGIAKRIL